MPIDYTKGRPSAAPTATTGKVRLTKDAPVVSLAKHGVTSGQLRVNLQWSTGKPARGGLFGSRGGTAIDLDLACLWEFTDGSKGVVQALGNSFQAPPDGAPIVRLDGDDRSGVAAGGENLFVDLSRLAEIRRVLVFAFIYEGVPNWASADGVVTLVPASGPQVEVRLDEHDSAARMCAIAMLENVRGEPVVRREVRYVRGSQADVDHTYGWGMRWAAGRK